MQTIWSRAVSSRCTCRCLQCLNTARNGLCRRTTTTAGHRRVKFKDGIFVTYGTIFISGIIADKRRKDDERLDWDMKIAEVNEETERLRQYNDDRLLAGRPLARAVKRGMSPRREVPIGRRGYSTDSAPAIAEDDQSCVHDAVMENLRGVETSKCYPSISEFKPGFQSPIFDNTKPAGSFDSSPASLQEQECPDPEEDSVQQTLRLRAIRILSAKRLALKFILRPLIHHSYGQPEQPWDVGEFIPRSYLRLEYGGDKSKHTQEILAELETLKKQMVLTRNGILNEVQMKEIIGPGRPGSDIEHRTERLRKDRELREIFDSYAKRRISMKDLIFQVAANLVQSAATPLMTTFEILIRELTRNGFYDLANMVIMSVRESRKTLNYGIINATLKFYARTKNLYGFDKYLQYLSGHDSSANFFQPWKKARVGAEEILIPPRYQATVLGTLIQCAFRFQQPHRADIWLAVAKSLNVADHPAVLVAYLRYSAIICDWQKGVPFLEKGLQHLKSIRYAVFWTKKDQMERLAYWILRFCKSCDDKDMYRATLQLAVRKRLHYTIHSRAPLDWISSAIMEDWRAARSRLSDPDFDLPQPDSQDSDPSRWDWDWDLDDVKRRRSEKGYVESTTNGEKRLPEVILPSVEPSIDPEIMKLNSARSYVESLADTQPRGETSSVSLSGSNDISFQNKSNVESENLRCPPEAMRDCDHLQLKRLAIIDRLDDIVQLMDKISVDIRARRWNEPPGLRKTPTDLVGASRTAYRFPVPSRNSNFNAPGAVPKEPRVDDVVTNAMGSAKSRLKNHPPLSSWRIPHHEAAPDKIEIIDEIPSKQVSEDDESTTRTSDGGNGGVWNVHIRRMNSRKPIVDSKWRVKRMYSQPSGRELT